MTDNIDVLDKGFVRIVDSVGDDKSIVDAARVSISGEGVKVVTKDEALIRYLMRKRHTTPFEMVDFKFHVKCPQFVRTQWMRHRTFSYNEMSGRYSELPEECYVPAPEHVRYQSKLNKQGRSQKNPFKTVVNGFIRKVKDTQKRVFQEYHDFLGKSVYENGYFSTTDTRQIHEEGGIARELARMNLPVSTYTEFYVKGNLHNWFHFLSLRADNHAQYEIRAYADAISKMISERVPISFRAFSDYRLNSMSFTWYDTVCLEEIIKHLKDHSYSLQYLDTIFPTKREFNEFSEKMKRFSIDVENLIKEHE